MNFKINSRPLFTTIFKLKNDDFKTRYFSPLIERVLTGVRLVVASDEPDKSKTRMSYICLIIM